MIDTITYTFISLAPIGIKILLIDKNFLKMSELGKIIEFSPVLVLKMWTIENVGDAYYGRIFLVDNCLILSLSSMRELSNCRPKKYVLYHTCILITLYFHDMGMVMTTGMILDWKILIIVFQNCSLDIVECNYG